MGLLTKQELHKYADKRISELSADQTIQRTPLEKSAVQHALLEQVTSYISQYTPEPRIISYAPNASGDVMGKFASQGRVFRFRLSNNGLVYKPVIQRKDNESEQDFALRFDTGSDILLEQLDRTDAAKAYKPKPTVSVPTKRGTKQNPNCSAVSYHCGVCISLGKNCIKNATTAALKERLQKINSLSAMAAKGEALPRVKTGVIGAKVDPKSLKRKVNDFVQKQAGGTKSKNAKVATKKEESVTTNKSPHEQTLAEYAGKLSPQEVKEQQVADKLFEVAASKGFKEGGIETPRVTPQDVKTALKGTDFNPEHFKLLSSGVRLIEGTGSSSGMYNLSRAPRKAETQHYLAVEKAVNDGIKVSKEVLKDYPYLAKRQQAALRAAAEPNKTTTLSTPYALTAQAQKRLERGESVSDYETYSISKEGDKYRVTDPQKFEDDGKLVDKAGLAAHFKSLEAQPKGIKQSGSMNPAIPITNNPDTMLRALRNGRLIGDAKQGYEIQAHPTEKGSYLITTMPNKKGDYSGTLSKKELVSFIKNGGDGATFNKESKTNSLLFPKKSGEDLSLSGQLAKGGDFTQKLPTTEEARKSLESNYVPLSSTKGMSSDRVKGNRNANQIAIDRTKKDVANATTQINKIDKSIAELNKGIKPNETSDESTPRLKKINALNKQKFEWEQKRSEHQAKLDKLSGKNSKGDRSQVATASAKDIRFSKPVSNSGKTSVRASAEIADTANPEKKSIESLEIQQKKQGDPNSFAVSHYTDGELKNNLSLGEAKTYAKKAFEDMATPKEKSSTSLDLTTLPKRKKAYETHYTDNDLSGTDWVDKASNIADKHIKQLEKARSSFKHLNKEDREALSESIDSYKEAKDLFPRYAKMGNKGKVLQDLNRLADRVAEEVEQEARKTKPRSLKIGDGKKTRPSRPKREMTHSEARISTGTAYRAREAKGQTVLKLDSKRLDACGCIPTPDSDRILTYITDNSGNMMGIVQMHGVKYRFLKPVYGDTVLTPVSETNLAYLFDLAPDLSLPQGVSFDSLKKSP